ncbi:MAG: hypothetical protein H6Q48_3423 [Deltaproteobacteria bacterium]|nr:hypothetical protein [Deltaproteobacteria bacterium]
MDETLTHLEIDGETVMEIGSGDLYTKNCLKCTHPYLYEDYRHLDEKAEIFRERRCCLHCIHFNEEDSTCAEGGLPEMGNPYRILSGEDCSGFRA